MHKTHLYEGMRLIKKVNEAFEGANQAYELVIVLYRELAKDLLILNICSLASETPSRYRQAEQRHLALKENCMAALRDWEQKLSLFNEANDRYRAWEACSGSSNGFKAENSQSLTYASTSLASNYSK